MNSELKKYLILVILGTLVRTEFNGIYLFMAILKSAVLFIHFRSYEKFLFLSFYAITLK
jgi:hypothetical protein